MRAGRGTLVGLLLILAAPGARAADPTGLLATAVWEGSALGRTVSGDAAWLSGAAGELRLEIRRTERAPSGAANFGALLGRHGAGWTVVTAPEAPGTVGAWGQEWKPAAPGLGTAVATLVAALAAGPPQKTASAGPWRAVGPAVAEQRAPVGALLAGSGRQAAPSFRRRLADRGRGRGGSGETLAWSWRCGQPDQAPLLRVRLTGRPGQVRIRPGAVRPVSYFDPEAWVPLWPLGDALPAGAAPEIPGTGAAPGR